MPSLTPDELAALDALVQRARADLAAGEPSEDLMPGDVVQLRPGIDRTWECSLLLIMKVDGYRIRGQLLRPHRGGCEEAWYRFKPGEAVRLGRLVFEQPASDVRSWCYEPPCPLQQRKPPAREGAPAPTFREAQALYRDERNAVEEALSAERVMIELQDGRAARKRALRAVGKRLKKQA